MTYEEMGVLLAKVQLGDNRDVDELVLDYWMDTVGDLELADALAALKRFRRERPGEYLEPGHLLELSPRGADVAVGPYDAWRDTTAEVLAESKAHVLAAAGVTEEEFEARKSDAAWVRATFARRELTGGER